MARTQGPRPANPGGTDPEGSKKKGAAGSDEGLSDELPDGRTDSLLTDELRLLSANFTARLEQDGRILVGSEIGREEKALLSRFMAECSATLRSLLSSIASSPRGHNLRTVSGELVDTALLEPDIMKGVLVEVEEDTSGEAATTRKIFPALQLRITSDDSAYFAVDPLFHGIENVGDAPFALALSKPDSNGGFELETHCSQAALDKLVTLLKVHEHAHDGNPRKCPSPLLSIAASDIEKASSRNFPAEPITLLEKFTWHKDPTGGVFEIHLRGKRYFGNFQLDEKKRIFFDFQER